MSSYLPPRIMIIDNDVVSRTFLFNALGRCGFSVIAAQSGGDAIRILGTLLENDKPDLIALDSELEDMSYVSVYETICDKKLNSAPIVVMLREQDKFAPSNKVSNILTDCIFKPIDQVEFIGKIRDLLAKAKTSLRSKIISHGDIQINLASYKVLRGGREVHLGPTEFKLLQCFIESPNKIFSREDLIAIVLVDRQNVELRTIDVHINRLRMALKNPGDQTSVIKTVRAAGYCLDLTETVH